MASPAYVVGSNGLKASPLIFGEPVAGAWTVTVVRWTVKKSPPSWLTRRTTSYVPAAPDVQVGAATFPAWSSLLKMPTLFTPLPPAAEPPTVLVPSADTWPPSQAPRYR